MFFSCQPNNNKAEKLAAKKHKQILILIADKENVTVIIKSKQYEEKLKK